MKPYYQDEQSTIYLGDCRDILPELPKVDLVLTDPPYGISQKSNGLRELNYDFDDNPHLIFEILPLLQPNAFYIWCHTNQQSFIETELDRRGYLTRCLAWVKNNPNVMNGDKLWVQSVELCVYGKLPHSIHNGGLQYGHFYDSPDKERLHPTQKPLLIILRQVQASTNNGDLILDPFMGSGTTLVAAKKLGRKCIGIEISEKYCEIAVKRLAQSVMNFETPKERIAQGEL
jgi:site-specific DNA-methyltransferase (adenine-specific)